jgi:hypothetical protein
LVENCTIKPGYRSDYSVVVIELKFDPFGKGCGLWKLNNILLTDKDYVMKIKELIQSVSTQYLYDVGGYNFRCNNDIDESLFLEVLMMEIRGATISYSAYKKKEKDRIEKQLLDEIEAVESESVVDTDILNEKSSRKTSGKKSSKVI